MESIAIVPQGLKVDPAELRAIAGAIQIQVTRDVAGPWQVEAMVSAFDSVDDPALASFLCVYVVMDTKGRDGAHFHPENKQPFALVGYKPGGAWSLPASHEVLEMLVDPFGDRLVPVASPRDPGKQAEVLVEICDPCQGSNCAYPVAWNHRNVIVSDFCLPSFYGLEGTSGPYTFQNKIASPLRVARKGYLTWREGGNDNVWYQLSATSGPEKILGPYPENEVLGMDLRTRNFRGAIDRFPGLRRPAFRVDEKFRAVRRKADSALRKTVVKERKEQRREIAYLERLLS